jgi:hypothetical protein
MNRVGGGAATMGKLTASTPNAWEMPTMSKSVIEYARAVQKILAEQEAVFSLVPDYTLPEMAVKKCVVVPMGIEKKILSRQNIEQSYRVDVALLNKVRKPEEIENLISILENISDSLLAKPILSGVCVKTDFAPLYSVETILQKNLFVGVISLTIKVIA